MGDSISWIIILVGVLILILLVLFIFVIKKKRKRHEPDYYNFFIIGILWAVVGLLSKENSFFLIMGLAFMIISLIHKKNWKKNHRTWRQLSKEEKKWKVLLIIGLIILLILGLVAYLLTK